MLETQRTIPVSPLGDEFLSTAEVARRLHRTGKTIRSKVAAGVFLEGVHFFRPPGSQMLWDWQAVVRWVHGEVEKRSDKFLVAGSTVEGKSA